MLKINSINLFFVFISLFFSLRAYTQQLDTNDSKRVNISGSIGTELRFYDVNGIDPKRPPLFWNIRGSLNINILNKVSIPFNFNFSQQNSTYSHPFNQFGISPKYKFITTHIGYSSMRFSDYSLNGINFLGLGLELMPEKSYIRGKALIGRFVKSVSYSLDNDLYLNNPSFERWGFGLNFELGSQMNNLGFLLFRAQDISSSISNIPSDFSLNPAENLILGITTKQRIMKDLVFKAEIDHSAYTSNINEEIIEVAENSNSNKLENFLESRLSTRYSYAFNSNIDYSYKKLGLGIGYKRIGPGYQSMGTVFLDNNKEEYLFKIRGISFKDKLNYIASIGVQQSNIDESEVSSNNRLIGLLNLAYAFNSKINMNLSYANFNTSNNITQINHADSIRYVQTTNNLGLTFNYNFKKNDNTHAFMFLTNFSEAYTLYKTSSYNYILNDTIIEVQGVERETASTFYNVNLSYNVGFDKSNTFINTTINYSDMSNENVQSQTIGPMLSFGKKLMKNKMRLTMSLGYLNTIIDSKSSGSIINTRFSASYTLKTNHLFRFYALNVNRNFSNSQYNSYSEFRVGIKYQYRF